MSSTLWAGFAYRYAGYDADAPYIVRLESYL
jgi:hypothetical protein